MELTVGISDMKIASGDDVLTTFALGSCVGISFYDPILRLGALLHILLPENTDCDMTIPFRFADTGVEETVRRLLPRGFARERAVVKIAGGARMFDDFLQYGGIGDRNVANVKAALARERLRVYSEDTGGRNPRTMTLYLATGDVRIRSGQMEKRI